MKAYDRNLRTAVLASVLFLGLVLVLAVVSANPSGDAVLRRPSTFFTDQTGGRAIYLVLEQLMGSVEQWRRPLTELDVSQAEERPTLIVMGPTTPLSANEAVRLDNWISSGGQLILATGAGWPVGPASEEETSLDYLARHGIDRVELPDDSDGAGTIRASSVTAVGRGRIVYVPDSHAFSNSALGTSDNAVWLVEAAARWSPSVLFDEYHHGFGERRGLFSLIGRFLMTPWGLVCLQFGLAGAVYIFGTERRFGKPVDPLTVERTHPTEAVEALGSLFEVAQARGLSGRTIAQHLNARLSALVGYPVDLSNPEIRRRLASRADLDPIELRTFATAVEGLSDPHRSSDEALIRIARNATAIERSFSHGADRDPRRTLADSLQN